MQWCEQHTHLACHCIAHSNSRAAARAGLGVGWCQLGWDGLLAVIQPAPPSPRQPTPPLVVPGWLVTSCFREADMLAFRSWGRVRSSKEKECEDVEGGPRRGQQHQFPHVISSTCCCQEEFMGACGLLHMNLFCCCCWQECCCRCISQHSCASPTRCGNNHNEGPLLAHRRLLWRAR